MKKRFALLLIVIALFAAGCSKGGGGATELRFTDALDISAIRKLDGKEVSIIGYMATLSPLAGDYIYLMNLPYQNCPFCLPNSAELTNTMAVYARAGKPFDYTEQAVRVTGKMELGDYVDDFGYVYNYRIVDASYETVDLAAVSQDHALWTSLAADGIVGEVTRMLDYLYFVSQWTEYTYSQEGANGEITSQYVGPLDALDHLSDTGPTGLGMFRADGYFDGLLQRVNALSTTELTELTEIIQEAKALEAYAVAQLVESNFTYDEVAGKYFLTNAPELIERYNALYSRYAVWLNRWGI
ncbi:MAG: hypothetical protein ACOYI5_06880 [Christensenellales bacterium]|jgi:hypothetical protein